MTLEMIGAGLDPRNRAALTTATLGLRGGIGETSPEADDDRRHEKNEDHSPDDPRHGVSLYEQEHIDDANDDDDLEASRATRASRARVECRPVYAAGRTDRLRSGASPPRRVGR